jgi:acetylxylan esterase
VYPDLYKAAAAYAGVPAGCFYTGTVAGWNSTCANGQSITTQEHWARTALDMYPGYTGPRPRMLIYHGSADTTIYPRVSPMPPKKQAIGPPITDNRRRTSTRL